jgi:hypothetical protein
MKKYLVFDQEYRYRGFLSSKEDRDLFMEQRNMEEFNIEEVSEKEFLKMEKLSIEHDEAGSMYGYILMRDEEHYLFESFDQMIQDFHMILTNIIKDVLPFLKLGDEEEEKVNALLQIVYTRLSEAGALYCADDIDDSIDFDDFYKMDVLTKIVVDMFGGKKEDNELSSDI